VELGWILLSISKIQNPFFDRGKGRTMPESYWDKASLYYDGVEIDETGATRHIYFVLKWLQSHNLLQASGKLWLEDSDDVEVGLYREDVIEEAALFLDRYYREWYDGHGIINFQIDPDLEFKGDEGLEEYWEKFRGER